MPEIIDLRSDTVTLPSPEMREALAAAPDAATVVNRAREQGLLIFAFGPRTIRAVTHLDVSREQCGRAADFLLEIVGG